MGLAGAVFAVYIRHRRHISASNVRGERLVMACFDDSIHTPYWNGGRSAIQHTLQDYSREQFSDSSSLVSHHKNSERTGKVTK